MLHVSFVSRFAVSYRVRPPDQEVGLDRAAAIDGVKHYAITSVGIKTYDKIKHADIESGFANTLIGLKRSFYICSK